jgi:predicted methyltransferase MtxX (methanogen marker protein 4)
MKNEYAPLRATLTRLDEVRAEHNRRSSLNTGVISGGLDMSETGDEILALIAKAEAIVSREIARGCRLSHLNALVREYGASRSIQEMIRDAEREAEYRRDGWDRR